MQGEEKLRGVVGPYATKENGLVRLNEAGKRFCEEYIAQHGSCAGLLISRFPKLYHAMVRFGVRIEEIRMDSMIAVAMAARYYHPERGAFSTFLAHYLRLMATRRLAEVNKRREERYTNRESDYKLHADDDTQAADFLDTVSGNGRSAAEDHTEQVFRESAGELARLLVSQLPTEKYRAVMAQRFGLNGQASRSLTAIGNELGVSKERVRQIERISLRYMKQYMKQNNIDINDYI